MEYFIDIIRDRIVCFIGFNFNMYMYSVFTAVELLKVLAN